MDSVAGGDRFAALPPEAPLAMPVQSLRQSGRHPLRGAAPRGVMPIRIGVIGGAILLTAAAAREMYHVLSVSGLTVLELIILVLFVTLFAWIALAFTSAIGGFVAMLAGGGRRLGIAPGAALPALGTRTALLMPTYNESPARVMGGLQAIIESLDALAVLPAFDVFILSDTTDPDAWIAEEAAFLALRARCVPAAAIFYRRRAKNIERKAGNIGEWVRRFGAAYPQMLVLDADSVMTGDAIVRLAAAMERHPEVGLIQTLPVIVNGTTLFARMQQFAGRVYGPLIAQGIALWHGADGNYWGHNAMIRTAAFARDAGLPLLSGRKPFGGHILSHDFVEAALMRRGGWAIHMVPALHGSFEESPPSLTDLAIRDRRWCQGNLQHAAVLPARGLHWVSRLHLLMGIGSYVTAPLWLLFLVTGMLISLQARFVPPNYFPSGYSLFPLWPSVDPVRSKWVFVGTMAVLLLPKLLSFFALLFDRVALRGCGGAVRAFASLLLETLIGGLLAPVAMVMQSVNVVGILAGRDSGWQTQRRDDGSIPFRQVFARYWTITLFGCVLGLASWLISLPLLLWMSPVVLGLVLAIPLAGITAQRGPGQALRRLGLLRIPEEQAPPAELARATGLARQLEEPGPSPGPGDGIRRLAADPVLLRAHLAMLPPPRRPREGAPDPVLLVGLVKLAEAESLDGALSMLTKQERAAVLTDAGGVARVMELAQGGS